MTTVPALPCRQTGIIFKESYMELEHNWNGRPYHSLDWELKHTFGHKVYKLSLDAGLTCPNRDGTCGPGDAFSAAKAVPEILRKA